MQLSFRARLMVLSLMLVGVAWTAAYLTLETSLQGLLEERVESELTRHAKAYAHAIAVNDDDQPGVDVERLARAMAEGSGVRLTFIRDDGTVRADSALSTAALVDADNHGDREEVRAARRDGVGRARRLSATVDENLLYVAIKTPQGDVVRAAMPLREVTALMARARAVVLLSGVVALLVSFLMSLLSSWWASQTVRRLVLHARKKSATLRLPEVKSDDDIDALTGSFDRITDNLDHALRRIIKERDRLEAVIEGMDDGVVALNWEGRIRMANQAFSTLVQRETSPLEERIVDVLPEVGAFATPIVDDKNATAPASSSEISVRDRTLVVRRTPLRKSRGSVFVFHDVTAARRVEGVRRDFVANVSHELRTPIAIMRANAEALANGALDERARAEGFVDAILRNADRLARLVDDLLDLSRIESGHFTPKFVTVRFADLMGRVGDVVGDVVADRGHDIELDIEDGLTLVTDDVALEHVIVNLVENAAKYTPEGGRITIRASHLDLESCSIIVEDNGPGIPRKDRERVFERFFRVDEGRAKDQGGTGLGLSIVKHFVHALGGTVVAEASDPHGCRMVMVLPNQEPPALQPPKPALTPSADSPHS